MSNNLRAPVVSASPRAFNRSLGRRRLLLVAVAGALPAWSALALTEDDFFSTFPKDSNNWQDFVPPVSDNLLATATRLASQAPNGGENTSTNYGTLTDGSVGIVPASGGGGPNAVSIKSNTTLTYSLASPDGYNISKVDIFTNWGDGGRFDPTVSVKYATVADPTTFLTLKDVDFRPASGNSAWVSLYDLGIANVAVSKLQFVFGTQQNGYVGYTELALKGSAAPNTDGSRIWGGEVNGNWDTTTANWSGAPFTNGEGVRFQDTNASGQTVNNRNVVVKAGGVSPSKVLFLNSASYSFSNAAGDATGITGATSVEFKGSGTVTFNSPNTYTGGTKVFGGTLVLAGTGTMGVATNTLYVSAPGAVDLGGTTQTVGQLGSTPLLGNSGTITNGTINLGTNSAYVQSGTMTANLTSTPASAARLFVGGDSGGVLLLGGVNTVDNADGISTKIGDAVTGAAGTVMLASPTALGTGNQSTQVTAGTLDFNGQNGVTTKSVLLTSAAASVVNNNSASAVTYLGLVSTTAGTDTNGAPVVGGAGALTLSNVISGAGGLRKTGGGTLSVTGTANTYSGVTIFEGGVLNVASLADYGQNGSLGNRATGADGGQNVSMLFRGGTLQYTGTTPQSTNRPMRFSTTGNGGAIDASGANPNATLNFTAADSPDWWENGGVRTFTLTGSNTGTNTLAGSIRDIPGTTVINLQKTGAGSWYLTNTNSSYKGQTIVGGGILNVASLSDYGVNGSLGNRTAADDQMVGTVRPDMGLLFRGGTLQYTGSTPTSTNRFFRMGLDGGTIDASGTTPAATVSFTANAPSPNLYENGGTRTLTLAGSNSGNNTFGMVLNEYPDATTTTTNLAKSGTGTWVLTGANVHRGTTTVNGGLLRVTGSVAVSSGVTVNGGTFEAAASQSVKKATVNAGGTLAVGGGTPAAPTVLKLGDNAGVPLTLSGNGRVDLRAGAVALDLSPTDMPAGLIATRQAILGKVNVVSTTASPSGAIGYATAEDLYGAGNGGTFLGTSVDSSTVLARYTLAGDATLDGVVDFNDLVNLAQNYNTSITGATDSWWYRADFTGDGTVDFNDLVLLAQNYNTSLPAAGEIPGAPANFQGEVAAAFASVPEPSAVGLVVGGLAAGALRRRRRAVR